MSEVAFLVGQTIVHVLDGRIIFHLGDEAEPRLYADLGPSLFTDRTGDSSLIDPSDPSGADALAALIGCVVSDTSTTGGTLRLTFGDGSSLRCESQPMFEAWQVVGGSPQYFVVCPAGGGEVAVWDVSTPPLPAAEIEAFLEKFRPPK